jgi:hypothetical protein
MARMSRAPFGVAVVSALLGAGCLVHEHHHAYRHEEVAADYTYHGRHPIPPAEGGGWCLLEGEHVHPYAPDYDDYAYDGQDYVYDGPVEVPYDGEHWIPEGGFCFLEGVHFHDYLPPGGDASGFSWSATAGAYAYRATGIGYHPAAPVTTARGGAGAGGAPGAGPGAAPLSPTALRGHLGGPPGWQSAPPSWGPPLQRPPPAAKPADYAWRTPVPSPTERVSPPAAAQPSQYYYQPPLRSWTIPGASGYPESRTEHAGPAEHLEPGPGEGAARGAPVRMGSPGVSSAAAAPSAPASAPHATPAGMASHGAPPSSSSHVSTSSGTSGKAH